MCAKISVIITAYNIEEYIVECIESVQKQRFDGIEIICVDDASTDETWQIIEDHARSDSRIRLFRNDVNHGAAYSRNRGIQEARGKYIWIIDGDDLLGEGALNRLYNVAEENSLDLITFSGEAFVDKNLNTKKYNGRESAYRRNGAYNGIYTGPDLFCEFIRNHDITGNLVLQFIRRQLFIENNLYKSDNLRYADDSPFSIYMSAKRVACIPDVLYKRRFRTGSAVTSRLTMIKLESFMLAMTEDMKVWENTELSDSQNETIYSYFRWYCRCIQQTYHQLNTEEKEKNFSILKTHPMAEIILRYFVIGESVYPELSSAKLTEWKKNGTKINLYGAGAIAEDIADVLDRNGISEYSVIVSEKKVENQMFRGRKVYAINEINDEKRAAVTIVAVSKIHHDVIRRNLEKEGITNTVFIL